MLVDGVMFQPIYTRKFIENSINRSIINSTVFNSATYGQRAYIVNNVIKQVKVAFRLTNITADEYWKYMLLLDSII